MASLEVTVEIDAERVDRLIDGIYEAAVTPDRWSDALGQVSKVIGATGAAMMWADGPGTSIRRGDLWDIDLDVLNVFQRDYVTICPRIRMSRDTVPGQVYDDEAARRQAEGAVRGYYGFLDRNDLGQARVLNVEMNADHRIGMVFYRPIGHESRAREEERLLRAIWPHVRRASHLTIRMAEVAERAEFGEDLFEMSSAMLLVDESGRVRRMNARAEAALALGDGLLLVQGQLQAFKAPEDAKLRREIAAALSLRAAPLAEGFALVTRPSGQPAWAVSAVPLPQRLRQGLSRVPPRALITLAETVPRVSPGRLRRGFGLSQAEAEIAAALAGGMQLTEIAERRGASVETVRSQLKSLFAKLEVSTQAQLVGRIAAVAGVVSSPHFR